MSSSSASDKQLFGRPPPPSLSRDDTASIWKDLQQALSLPKCVPSNVQRLLATIKHLLLTNDPPSSQETIIVSECVRLIDGQVAKLDAANPATMTLASIDIPLISTPQFHMSSTQSASINKRTTPRRDLLCLRKRVQSVVSVVRQLPPEIWQEIFLFVPHDNGVFAFCSAGYVYRIGQVCRTWRIASHRSPRLWSRLDISVSSKLPHNMSHFRTVLERSCTIPLDFIFKHLDAEHEVPTTQILSLLTQHSSRWQSAQFIGMTFAETLLLENVRGRIPLLRSVRLDVVLQHREFERTDTVSAFEIAPKLSRVDLSGLSLDQVPLDKQNLQYLHVKHHAEEQSICSLSSILRASPKLTDITHHRTSALNVVTWPLPLPLSTPRTAHTSLTTLSISDGDSIDAISLPNLTQLDAGSGGQAFVPTLLPCIVVLLQHSRCRLASLHLRFAEWDEDSMGRLLSLIPDLQTLSISSGGLPGIEDMMSVLTRFLGETSDDGSRPKYVPRLKTLYICMAKWAFTNSVFLEMVAMREERGALEVVDLHGSSRHGEPFPNLCCDELKRWKIMRRKGLIVTQVWVPR